MGLLTGRDFWSTIPTERIGLRAWCCPTAPRVCAARVWDERYPSISLPVRHRAVLVLGPASGRGVRGGRGGRGATQGRRCRARADDQPAPLPAGRPALRGVQRGPAADRPTRGGLCRGTAGRGVGATPKHYVANDFETDRFTADVQVERPGAARGLPGAVRGGGDAAHAWLVMSAYNSVNGATATENDLLETPLNSEWGFDGVVVSDWTAVRSIAAARPRRTSPCPARHGAWGDALVAAVRSGDIPRGCHRPQGRPPPAAGRRASARSTRPAAEAAAGRRPRRSARAAARRRAPCCPQRRHPAAGPRIRSPHRRDRAQRRRGTDPGRRQRDRHTREGVTRSTASAGLPGRAGRLCASAPSCRKDWRELPLAELVNPVTGEPGVHLRLLDAGHRDSVHRGPAGHGPVVAGRRRPDRAAGRR